MGSASRIQYITLSNCSHADFKAVDALHISRNVKSNFYSLVKEETKKSLQKEQNRLFSHATNQ